MKKIFSILFVTTLLLTGLSACGRKIPDTSTPSKLQDSVTESTEASVTTSTADTETSVSTSAEDNSTSVTEGAPALDDGDLFPGVVNFNDEVFDYYAVRDWQKAYRDVLRNYSASQVIEDMYTNILYYYLYDIDEDEIPELLVKTGTYEAEYMINAYKYADASKTAELIGSYSYGHSQLYSYPGGNGVISVYGHMGEMNGYLMEIKDGKLVYNEEPIFTDDANERMQLYPDESYTPVEELVDGSYLIDEMPITYEFGLLEYMSRIGTMGEYYTTMDLSNDVDDILMGNKTFYGVLASPFYTSDLDKCGETTFIDFCHKIFYDETAMPVEAGYNVFDLNADGQCEIVVAIQPENEHVIYVIAFSYQNGTIYGYSSPYFFESDVEMAYEQIFISNEYADNQAIYFHFYMDQAYVQKVDTRHIAFTYPAYNSLVSLRQDMSAGDGLFLGVTYLGVSSYWNETFLYELLNEAAITYADEDFMKELNKVHYVTTPGSEVYLLNPATEDISLSIYEYYYSEYEGDFVRGKLLYDGAPGEMILLRANVSDIMPNTVVVIHVNGQDIEYSPSLSGEDGEVCVDEFIGDLTRYG